MGIEEKEKLLDANPGERKCWVDCLLVCLSRKQTASQGDRSVREIFWIPGEQPTGYVLYRWKCSDQVFNEAESGQEELKGA